MEFGDFQTPDVLAQRICQRLVSLGIQPEVVIEPTCGVGSFVMAAAQAFPEARIKGFEVNRQYLDLLGGRLERVNNRLRVSLEEADFFELDWRKELSALRGSVLVVGNFPWVTNAVQGTIGGTNLPAKSNFQGFTGFDAISGKSNFDISEWMLIEVLRWFEGRSGDVAMLVKTSVARKVLAYAEKSGSNVREAFVIGVSAQKYFGAAVDACLLVIRLTETMVQENHDYVQFESLDDARGKRVGQRNGLAIGDVEAFESTASLLGESPQKWRSGIKHDASGVMEMRDAAGGLVNGNDEVVCIESTYLFPLLKGTDVGRDKAWRGKYMLVPQRRVGEDTAGIRDVAPQTWEYLVKHAEQLSGRKSTIYSKAPQFAIFGVGEYAFRPWKIAVSALHKMLEFRLIGPIDGKPVVFDDTVYYLSFDSEEEARATFAKLNGAKARSFLSSLIFWDEKRPIKTGILNRLDWSLA